MKNKKLVFLILLILFAFLPIAILSPISYLKTNIKEKEDATQQNNITLNESELSVEDSEDLKEGDKFLDENQADLIEKSSKTTSDKLPGQITECLYSVKNIPSPKGLAFSPSSDEIWVTSLMNRNKGVVVFDIKDGSHIKDIVLPGGGGVEIIFNKSGSFAYISQMETGRIFEVNASTKEISRIFNTSSFWTKVLFISPDESKLFASNWSGNDISVIDLYTGNLIEKISTVETPRGIYVTKNNILLVAGFKNGEIEKINLENKTKSKLARTNGAMRHIVADEEKEIFYFSDMGVNAIYKLNAKNNEVEKFADTEINPNTIALTPDKRTLIVSNRGTNYSKTQYNIPGKEWGTIIIFDAKNGKMLDVILGGNQPTALSVNKDGSLFAYSNFLDGEVVVCKMPDYDTLAKGDGGSSISYREYIRK